MSMDDLEAMEVKVKEVEEEFEEEEGSSVEEDLGEALNLLEDCRELLLLMLEPPIWESKYVSNYVKREIGKLEIEILQFTDQWKADEGGEV